MDVDSPRSPIAQFSVASDQCSTSYVCPNAPRKPNFRREQEQGSFSGAVRCAREHLESIPKEERSDIMKQLPRHTLEALDNLVSYVCRCDEAQPYPGVFLAYCHWQAGTQWAADFQALLQVAPCLEQELLDHVQRTYSDMTWAEWTCEVQRAVADPYHGQHLAQRTMMDACPMRRILF